MKTAIPKTSISEHGARKEVRRDMRAWRALRGIWRGKKMPEPVDWQRRMRRDINR